MTSRRRSTQPPRNQPAGKEGEAPPTRRAPRRPFPPVVAIDHPLTKRERLFVAEYLVDLNGAQAAVRAGYKPQNAAAQASRLSTKANVQAALAAAYKAREARTLVTADSTVRELGRIAHCDIRKFYDEAGHLKPVHELPHDLAACIASVEVVRRNMTSGDGTTEVVYKIRFWNKPQALELLGRHQGIFREDQPSTAPACPAFALPEGCSGVSVH